MDNLRSDRGGFIHLIAPLVIVILVVVALVAVYLLAPPRASPQTTAGTCSVQGYARGGTTTNLLAGVTVSASGVSATAVTSSQGAYVLTWSCPGPFFLVVRADASTAPYCPSGSSTSTIVSVSPGSSTRADFILQGC